MAPSNIPQESSAQPPASASPTRIGARAAVGVIAVAVATLALWRLRTLVILLLLAVTFAAALRPPVEALRRRRVPQSLAIFLLFALGIGVFVLFFWLALPPAIRQVHQALTSPRYTVHGHGHGFEYTVISWINRELKHVPSGSAVIHPIATYGRKGTEAVVGILFTFAATWYLISGRDSVINTLVGLSPERKRERARETYEAIDERLGAYTRLKFLMVFVTAAVLAIGFSLVGLHYWLLLAGLVGLLEIIPVVGPLVGSILVVVVGLGQSVHVAVLALVIVVVVREFQTYVINPHVMGQSVGLTPLVTLVTVSAVGILFGPLAVVLAIPATSAAATLIDVLVLEHAPPAQRPGRRLSLLRRRR